MQLLPHQIEDAAFLAERKFVGCFNGMGSGKTLLALRAAELVNSARTLILAPPIAMPMWKEVSEDYFENLDGLDPIKVQILKSGTAKIDPDCRVIVCSYQIATKRRDELKDWGADVLICDESHALKSVSSKRTKAVLGKGGICESADHTWLLTGTPSTRYADDWFPFLVRAANGKLKDDIGGLSLERFQLKYCVRQRRRVKTKYGREVEIQTVVGSRNLDQLNELIFGGDKPLAVRRTIQEVHDAMPPLTFNTLQIGLTQSDELKEAMKTIKGMSITQIAQQLTSSDTHLATLRRLLGIAKVPAAAEVIAERIADDPSTPVLVGAWHREVIDALADALADRKLSIRRLTGSTSSPRREQIISDFNKGWIDGLVGQIGAMGVSLNLQKLGHRILTVEEDYSPAVMDQFYARLWRMGQEKHVHVDRLRADNKLDKAVAQILGRKAYEHAKTLEQMK